MQEQGGRNRSQVLVQLYLIQSYRFPIACYGVTA